jgi:hypothetical protein
LSPLRIIQKKILAFFCPNYNGKAKYQHFTKIPFSLGPK